MAPEIPIAIYKLGLIAKPVCPTCSLCGRQFESLTGLLHAVAAPSSCASSSTIPQFSGPFKPRPADMTNSASGKGIIPAVSVDLVSLITNLDLIAETRRRFNVPIAAYSVSGEYALVKGAAKQGWVNEKDITEEILYCIKRAGADMIVIGNALERNPDLLIEISDKVYDWNQSVEAGK